MRVSIPAFDTDKWPPCCHRAIHHVFAAFILAAVLILPAVARMHPPVPYGDSVAYLSIAADLHDTGVFGDGNFRHMAAVTGPGGQGMFFAPLYPAFLSLLMRADPGLHAMADCLARGSIQTDAACPLLYRAVLLAQGLIAALSSMLVFLAALVVTDRKRVAWLAFALVLATGVYARYAGVIMTETLTFPLFTLACLLGVLGFKKRSGAWMLASGLAWGLLCLNRPSFPYLVYFTLAAGAAFLSWRMLRRRSAWPFARLLLLLACGYALSAGPWMLRNGLTLGSYGISKGYAAFILAQRVAYNDMTPREWCASLVYSLPDFGDNLARSLFRPDDYKRFAYDSRDGFYATGNDTLLRQTLQQAGSADRQAGFLIRHYILAHPLKHILVTLSLAWSGMWVAKYWGLVTIPMFAGVAIQAWRRRWWAFLLFAWPAWFMLGFNAFTSVNIVRYNLILLPCLAIAAAWTLSRLYDRMTAGKLSNEPD